MFKNKTPYLGKMKFSFEKNPLPSQDSPLNGVILNLGFTKLVSRINLSNGVKVHPETVAKIEKETGLFIHDLPADQSPTCETLHYQCFHPNGDHMGSIEIGWWFLQMKMRATKGKSINTAWNTDGKQWVGFSGPIACAFGKGDKVFDPNWVPSDEDLLNLQKYYCKRLEEYEKEVYEWSASTSDKKVPEEQMTINYWALDHIPYNLRGTKVIKSYEDAYDSALTFANTVSFISF